jgi:hypothetical protein
LETGGSLISQSQSGFTNSPTAPNAAQWSVGAFGDAKISDYLSFTLHGGFTGYALANATTNEVIKGGNGLYLEFSATHRVSQFINYTLTAGQSTDLSAYGQAQSYYYIRLNPQWNLFRKYTVSTPVSWRHSTRVYNTTTSGNANYDQWELGVDIRRSITQKLSASVNYQLVKENANLASSNYTVNQVGLNLSYQF